MLSTQLVQADSGSGFVGGLAGGMFSGAAMGAMTSKGNSGGGSKYDVLASQINQLQMTVNNNNNKINILQGELDEVADDLRDLEKQMK